MPEPMRHKVGDVDPAGQKALQDAISGKPTPPVKAAPAVPAAMKRSILSEIRDAIDEHIPRETLHGVGGEAKTVDQVVDEAVSGVNKAKRPDPDHS